MNGTSYCLSKKSRKRFRTALLQVQTLVYSAPCSFLYQSKKKARKDEMGSNFHTFDCAKSLGSPLGTTRWNVHKIKVSNIKTLLALSSVKSSLVDKTLSAEGTSTLVHAAFSVRP